MNFISVKSKYMKGDKIKEKRIINAYSEQLNSVLLLLHFQEDFWEHSCRCHGQILEFAEEQKHQYFHLLQAVRSGRTDRT